MKKYKDKTENNNSNSTIQQFNNLTIQQFNNSTIAYIKINCKLQRFFNQ